MDQANLPSLGEISVTDEQEEPELECTAGCDTHAKDGYKLDKLVATCGKFAQTVNGGENEREEAEESFVVYADEGAGGETFVEVWGKQEREKVGGAELAETLSGAG